MLIELKQITIRYDHKPTVIDKLDLAIKSGDFVILQGESGSGKTTLLRTINHLQSPASGEILVDNLPVDEQNIPHLRRRVVYVQQTPVMISGSVYDNFQWPFRFSVADGAACPNRNELRELMNRFHLADVELTDEANRLSVGQRQRVALIRASLLKPDVLLCDEPTSALDQKSRETIERWLEQINRENNTTVVVVTHLPFHCHTVTPRAFVLKNGAGLHEADVRRSDSCQVR
jgi:putative ABC transport system ATP-binding protein